LSTVFVRVPDAEWGLVKYGNKREFRAACAKHSPLRNVATPTPAVAYCVNSFGEYRSALMVLENIWREPLGAISPESLAAEGSKRIASSNGVDEARAPGVPAASNDRSVPDTTVANRGSAGDGDSAP
jgi:hypothetical protein